MLVWPDIKLFAEHYSNFKMDVPIGFTEIRISGSCGILDLPSQSGARQCFLPSYCGVASVKIFFLATLMFLYSTLKHGTKSGWLANLNNNIYTLKFKYRYSNVQCSPHKHELSWYNTAYLSEHLQRKHPGVCTCEPIKKSCLVFAIGKQSLAILKEAKQLI